MEIHCLGTTGYHPSDTRHTSCYMLAKDGIVLDAGTGSYRLAPLIETDSIDILLSHAHLDHVAGLTFLLDVFFQRPVKTVRLWGKSDKLNAVRDHLFHESLFPVPLRIDLYPIDNLDSFSIGIGSLEPGVPPVVVDWKEQEHPGGSVAYRLHWKVLDKTLVYATDTTGDESDDMRQWIDGADLLMHECYFKDHEKEWALKTGHCWTTRAANIAKHGRVKKLLLTHVSPLVTGNDPVDIAKARSIFANSHIANDYDVVDF